MRHNIEKEGMALTIPFAMTRFEHPRQNEYFKASSTVLLPYEYSGVPVVLEFVLTN